jgi:hypothetical protein
MTYSSSNERIGVRRMLALGARSLHDTLVFDARDALGIEGQHTMSSVSFNKQLMQWLVVRLGLRVLIR